jgi:membrane-associated phospholipid phosphatase
MTYFTKAISIIFHPLFIPMYAFLMYLQIEHFAIYNLHSLTDAGFWFIFTVIFVFTCLLPLLSLNMMRYSQMVSDWEVSNHKERVPLLIASSVFLSCLYYLFSYLEIQTGNIFENFYAVLMGGIVLGLISAIISHFWKISLHAMMISGLAGAMIGLTSTMNPILNKPEMVFYNSILLIIVGIVAFSRLHQKAHNILQVLAGMMIGFGVMFLVVNKGWYF